MLFPGQMLNQLVMTFFPSIFKDVFEKDVNTLLERCPYDGTIDLEEGAQPPFGPIYNLSQNELATFHEYIYDNLEKGFIWHSKSPTNAPILFVKKKDGSFVIVC